MYNLPAYGKMILDRGRMDAYIRALRQSVGPESIVVDLGCGPGLFALKVCEFGARRVFAIEPNDVIQVGRDTAQEHGFGERIEFIQELSTRVSLPEKADVIVSDLRGVLPWFTHHIESIVDARTRFLAPGGVLIPRSDKLWVAIVEVPEQYERLVKPWNGECDGLRLNSARNFAVNLWSKYRVRPENLLSEAYSWFDLDYRHITEPNFQAAFEVSTTRAGTAHGFVLWFDSELIEGIGFSNAPGGEEMIYAQGFFPLQEPVQVAANDRIDMRLEGRLIGDDYVWRWDTLLPSQKIKFKQSTLLGAPLSVSKLRKRAHTHAPAKTAHAEVVHSVLSQMDGTKSIETIAMQVVKDFPDLLGDLNEAFDFVTNVVENFGD